MELGDLGFRWILLVPEFGGNQTLPEDERISLEIERLRMADVMSARSEDIGAWRKSDALKPWLESEEFGPLIEKYTDEQLRVFRQFVKHARAHKNFVFGGQLSTDPIEIFLKSPPGLIDEITLSINLATRLVGQALKNFASLCAGSPPATDAQPAKGEGEPTGANTPPAPTG